VDKYQPVSRYIENLFHFVNEIINFRADFLLILGYNDIVIIGNNGIML
jgi:hypothetical protein